MRTDRRLLRSWRISLIFTMFVLKSTNPTQPTTFDEKATLESNEHSYRTHNIFHPNVVGYLLKYSSVRLKPGFGIGNRNQGPISVSVSELKFFVPKPKLFFSKNFNFFLIFLMFSRFLRGHKFLWARKKPGLQK